MYQLKTKLRSNQLSIGSWITMAHPAIAEIMAKAGFDWITVDLEHSVITVREAEELIRIISLAGASPLVRLTANDASQIKRVMDAGAHGVIVPHVNALEDVQSAVDGLYYPPKGKRGVGLARAQGYGPYFNAYLSELDQHAVIVAQIEHINALDNIDSILSHPDLDAYFIGPYDLSASMGLSGQFEHPEVVNAINQIRQAGKKANKAGGIHLIEPLPTKLQEVIAEGFTFIAYSLDIRMLDTACRDALKGCHAGE